MAYSMANLSVRVAETETDSTRGKRRQVVVNDAVRLLAGVHRRDWVKLADLRQDVTIPSVNYVVARESAMAAWWALASPSGSPLSRIMATLRPNVSTCGATDGLITNMAKIWNTFPSLAAAKTPQWPRPSSGRR